MGITTAIVGQDYSGIGFAIPSNTARQVCEQILASNAHVERGYVGLALQPHGARPASPGVVVAGVEPRSPAAMAGITKGDVVVAFDGEDVSDPAEFVLMVTRSAVGSEVVIDFIRDGERQSVEVRVGRRPHDE
jgi:S1-C subfamily serine protease